MTDPKKIPDGREKSFAIPCEPGTIAAAISAAGSAVVVAKSSIDAFFGGALVLGFVSPGTAVLTLAVGGVAFCGYYVTSPPGARCLASRSYSSKSVSEAGLQEFVVAAVETSGFRDTDGWQEESGQLLLRPVGRWEGGRFVPGALDEMVEGDVSLYDRKEQRHLCINAKAQVRVSSESAQSDAIPAPAMRDVQNEAVLWLDYIQWRIDRQGKPSIFQVPMARSVAETRTAVISAFGRGPYVTTFNGPRAFETDARIFEGPQCPRGPNYDKCRLSFSGFIWDGVEGTQVFVISRAVVLLKTGEESKWPDAEIALLDNKINGMRDGMRERPTPVGR
jgi:hypothetical protein